jgi:hypothetical protein|eukprot:SAG25_NODE_59_length_18387_cov_33.379770_9_plen_244_part_00
MHFHSRARRTGHHHCCLPPPWATDHARSTMRNGARPAAVGWTGHHRSVSRNAGSQRQSYVTTQTVDTDSDHERRCGRRWHSVSHSAAAQSLLQWPRTCAAASFTARSARWAARKSPGPAGVRPPAAASERSTKTVLPDCGPPVRSHRKPGACSTTRKWPSTPPDAATPSGGAVAATAVREVRGIWMVSGARARAEQLPADTGLHLPARARQVGRVTWQSDATRHGLSYQEGGTTSAASAQTLT